jgi:glycosyltransferase involved in cell wall biosynthesis
VSETLRSSADIDVLLLGEGTYPYVRGGVSSWIHDLITGLPEIKFGLVFLGARRQDYSGLKYDLPDNLRHLEAHYLFDQGERPEKNLIEGTKKAYALITEIHKTFRGRGMAIPDEVKKLDFYNKEVPFSQYLYSKRAWDFIADQYGKHCPKMPFLDYFWTLRNIHAPIWVVAEIAQRLKGHGRVLHSPSTGYAGLLGSLIHYQTRKPFIITEHGIYTRERKIDILKAEWIVDTRTFLEKNAGEMNYIRGLWIRFFETIGRICYSAADEVISLFDQARDIQAAYGAAPERTRVIPNGIDFERLNALVAARPEKIPKVIGLIGRVVSIKDIKTFIKAMRVTVNRLPEAQGWIIGPQEEDPEYTAECKTLAEALNLEDNIKFTGFRKIEEILPQLGAVTLTSVSEGMPLSVIEAFAAGVPAVLTDVGAARQLVEGGLDAQDRAIGKAGEVVGISDPQALSSAYIRLLADEQYWKACQAAAIERAGKYYTRGKFLAAYEEIYQKAFKKWRA